MTRPLTAKPISDLRRRMLEDMAVRRMSEKTQHDYIKHVETLTRFLGRAPDTATAEDLRAFQVHELQAGSRPPKMNTQASALRFFFGKTLGRPDLVNQLSRVDYPRKLARVLPMADVTRLLESAPVLAFSTRPHSALRMAPAFAAARWRCCASPKSTANAC